MKNPLNVELYNDKLYNKPPKLFVPLFKHDHATLNFPVEALTPFFTLSKIHEKLTPLLRNRLLKT